MAYPKQTWDTSSYVNPTRMNHIEDGIKSAVDGLTNIYIEGSTNNTGSTIASGTYFYLNGTLVRAKATIANGATFTLNTNYEVVTAGGLNEINNKFNVSTTAKVIGTFNGRTLYRKCFEYDEVNAPTNTDIKLTGSFGIDQTKVVNMSAVIRQSSAPTVANGTTLSVYISALGELYIKQSLTGAFNNAIVTIIVDYTD